MRIGLSIPSLWKHGGIERLSCWLASTLAEHGHEVFLFVSDSSEKPTVYPLHEKVHVICHEYTGDSRNLPAFSQLILACKPDVCVSLSSYYIHFGWSAALWGTGIPWVYSEHGTPSFIEQEMWNRPERLAAMTGADRIHLLRESFTASLPESLQAKVRVIPNPLLLTGENNERTPAGRHVLLSLGRLDRDKQNVLLLKAFASIQADFPDWDLEIWGDGPNQHSLQKFIARIDMGDRVRLCGPTCTAAQQYARASLFAMPSRHEAFGLAAVEALSYGLPVVGFAACQGIMELVQHGKTGWLAPEMTATSLAEGLSALMADHTLRQHMGKEAREAIKIFAPERVYRAWEQLLLDTAACKGNTRLREPNNEMSQEEKERYALLKRCIARPHLRFNESQIFHMFVWRHPWLHRIQHDLRKWLGLID